MVWKIPICVDDSMFEFIFSSVISIVHFMTLISQKKKNHLVYSFMYPQYQYSSTELNISLFSKQYNVYYPEEAKCCLQTLERCWLSSQMQTCCRPWVLKRCERATEIIRLVVTIDDQNVLCKCFSWLYFIFLITCNRTSSVSYNSYLFINL